MANKNFKNYAIAGSNILLTYDDVNDTVTFSTNGIVPYSGASQDLNLGTKNLKVNNVFSGFVSIVASATDVILTVTSVPSYLVTGSGGQTIKLPDATTLQKGTIYYFNNNQSSGAISINNNSNTLVASVPSGGYTEISLLDNSISAGVWERHEQAPSNVEWSTNTLKYAGSIIDATWNGVSIADNRIASATSWNSRIKTIVRDVTQSSTITGNTTEQIIGTYLIPANTFSANDMMRIASFTAEKSGTVGTATMRVKVGTNANGSGATTIAALSIVASNLAGVMTRSSLTIRGGNIRCLAPTSTIATDVGTLVIAFSNVAFDPTVNNYISTTLQLASATDTVFQSNFLVTN